MSDRAIAEVPVVLPGRVVLRRGCARDYERLKRFHYRGKRPATWAEVWVAEYFSARNAGAQRRLVAVGVLSYPTVALHVRDEVLGLRGMRERERIAFVNANVRTISRVIVHPQFRSAGLAVAMVRCLVDHCNTRYVEALAMMGKAHPFFEKAGMRRMDDGGERRPVYYLWERPMHSTVRPTVRRTRAATMDRRQLKAAPTEVCPDNHRNFLHRLGGQ